MSSAALPAGQQSRDPVQFGLKWSLGLHILIAMIALVRGLVFPSHPEPYIPSLKVDIVALPDLLKKDMERLKIGGKVLPEPQEEEVSKPEEKAPPEVKVEEPPSDDGIAPLEKKKDKARKEQISNALARIKALEKIKSQVEKASAQREGENIQIKGNILSKGTSLSGDARETSANGYHDQVLEQIRSHWTLPIWLSRQNLQAHVQITIDSKGSVRTLQFHRLSGNPQFDDLVKKAIYAAQPLPAPPKELAGKMLTDGIFLGFPL